MMVTVHALRTVVYREEYRLEINFEEMLEHLGLNRFEYNEDPDGTIEHYCGDLFVDLIDNDGDPPTSSERESDRDDFGELEFQSVERAA